MYTDCAACIADNSAYALAVCAVHPDVAHFKSVYGNAVSRKCYCSRKITAGAVNGNIACLDVKYIVRGSRITVVAEKTADTLTVCRSNNNV